MKQILLYNSPLVALVDDEDFESLSKFKWRLLKGRVYCRHRVDGKLEGMYMSRQILGHPKGKQVDHKNLNKLDHQRHNLRTATDSQNKANLPKTLRPTSSKFKGVTRRKNKWSAGIGRQGRTVVLGQFDNEIDAAKEYDKAAVALYGEFARINFPP